MKKILLVFSWFLLSGCTVQAEFTPEGEILREARVGVPYYNQINVFGGPVFAYDIYGGQVMAGDIHPENLGLYLQYCNEKKLNNCLQIRGIPTNSGVAKVRVHGGLGSGMLSKAGYFDKTYTIIIKDSEGSP